MSNIWKPLIADDFNMVDHCGFVCTLTQYLLGVRADLPVSGRRANRPGAVGRRATGRPTAPGRFARRPTLADRPAPPTDLVPAYTRSRNDLPESRNHLQSMVSRYLTSGPSVPILQGLQDNYPFGYVLLHRAVRPASTVTFSLLCAASAFADTLPVEILFVGNSFTFGKYAPVRNYMGGFDSGPGAVAGAHVHDLQCLTLAACSAAENVALSVPSTNPAVIANPRDPVGIAAELPQRRGRRLPSPSPARTAASRASS